ncbi:MAG: dihydropteroate synthase [Rickettsiales bacterium]|nr:dihydropteroate synthase [Rickettsiales bacterium]
MGHKIPKIMAILNVTPDSFSDGGQNLALESVKRSVDAMISANVDIIDVGAESTRPGAAAVSCKEEIRRLSDILPYIRKMIKDTGIKISLDSRHFETISTFVEYLDWINDVEFGRDSRILDLVRDYNKYYCFYFSTSVPVDKTKFLPSNTNLVEFFNLWISEQTRKYNKHGIKKEKLIFDPGIGFGLSIEQSLDVIKVFDQIDTLGIKTLIGHSRKTFLSVSGEESAAKRDPETHAVTSFLIQKNIDYIRVHNFQETQRILRVLAKICQ